MGLLYDYHIIWILGFVKVTRGCVGKTGSLLVKLTCLLFCCANLT
jgi:hypothetical protein